MPETLVIFDYSGTLSLAACAYARPAVLEQSLPRSGLAAFGLDTPDRLWRDAVMPTWEEGSTTEIGYIRLLMDRALLQQQTLGGAGDAAEAREAATRFVRGYLAASAVEPPWHPLLQRLEESATAVSLIATDHYAEATAAILTQLAACGVRGEALKDYRVVARASTFVVANSADLGVRKSSPRFWEIVRERLCPEGVSRLVVVDDFGANEEAGDGYSEAAKVRDRLVAMQEDLKTVFGRAPEMLVFIPPTGADREQYTISFVQDLAKRLRLLL